MRYKYITQFEVLEDDNNTYDLIWVLGKRKDKAFIRMEHGKQIRCNVRLLRVIQLPRLMTEKDAWAYLDEFESTHG